LRFLALTLKSSAAAMAKLVSAGCFALTENSDLIWKFYTNPITVKYEN
jgi:hypothetical protein